MSIELRRATYVALAVLFVLFAAPHIASAQATDDPSDYSSADYDSDGTPDAISELLDVAMVQPPTEMLPGVPAAAMIDLAQSPNASAAAPGVPARFLVVSNHFDIHADGSVTATSHIEMQLVSPQAVSILAQPAIAYSDSMQTLDIRSAYTLKRDGTRVPVAPDAILVRQKAVPSPLFTDMKEKVILFPNVEPGDTLVYDSVLQSRPPIPGQFYFGIHIPRVIEIDNETISFSTPRSLPLNFDTYGLAVQKGSDGDQLTYTVHYSNRTPTMEYPQFLSDLDQGQRLFASTAGNYDAMVQSYAPLVASRIEVTPRITEKAEEVTAGTTDRREQARRLYEWVSTHVRYVALLFGDGGVAPHSADTILANGYGDCKDHAVLYSALLKAKGIASQPVIINATNGYFLPQVPQLLTFNHMIVWLPEFGFYADTTADSPPFGQLPQFEYGKPVVRVGAGEALQHTPVLRETESTYYSSTVLQLDAYGRLSGSNRSTATGTMAGVMRAVANQAVARGLDAVAIGVLRARKLETAMGAYSFAPTTDLTPQYVYSSHYQTNGALQTDQGFSLPEGLNLIDAYSPVLLGPVADSRYLASTSVPCFSGTLVDDYQLQVPADKRVLSIPQDAIVTSSNIDYRAHWSFDGATLSVHRELHAHFDKALCTGDTLRQARQAIIAITRDYNTRVALISAHAS